MNILIIYIVWSVILGFLIKIKSKRSFILAISAILCITLIGITVYTDMLKGYRFSKDGVATISIIIGIFVLVFIFELISGFFSKSFEKLVFDRVLLEVASGNKSISPKEIAEKIGKSKKEKYIETILTVYKKKSRLPDDIEIKKD
ncbi:hypothetical protein [Arcobacter arenosus]|uniref:hypothetical protein n=1 Tax=Arcobacter arenosus TaxID=2576037 RepID=UPI003BA96462